MSAASTRNRRLAGIAGLCGALLFFVGDMLFYGHWGSGAGFHQGLISTVMNASLPLLFAGGLVGPVAACLCIVGFWHVYLNVRPAQARLAKVMLVAFVVLMVFGSAVHTLWTARGLAIKYCYGSDDLGCRALVQSVNSYWDLAYNLGAVPGYFGAILLMALVLLGKTWYPRWTALASPAALMLLSPLANRVPARLVPCCPEDSPIFRSQRFFSFRFVQLGREPVTLNTCELPGVPSARHI